MKDAKISIPHFYCLEYIEGNKRLVVEMDFRETKLFLGKSLIETWEMPYEKEKITEKKKEEICEEIQKYLLKHFNQKELVKID